MQAGASIATKIEQLCRRAGFHVQFLASCKMIPLAPARRFRCCGCGNISPVDAAAAMVVVRDRSGTHFYPLCADCCDGGAGDDDVAVGVANTLEHEVIDRTQ